MGYKHLAPTGAKAGFIAILKSYFAEANAKTSDLGFAPEERDVYSLIKKSDVAPEERDVYSLIKKVRHRSGGAKCLLGQADMRLLAEPGLLGICGL